jgi:hypothetical protein
MSSEASTESDSHNANANGDGSTFTSSYLQRSLVDEANLYDKDEDLATQTPIQNRYTFWYHRRGKAGTNYEEGMTQLASFQTVGTRRCVDVGLLLLLRNFVYIFDVALMTMYRFF